MSCNHLPEILTLLLLAISCQAVTNPGFQVAITNKALNFLQVVLIPPLDKQLASIIVPDISGLVNVGSGNVSYNISNIQITEVSFEESYLTTNPGQGLRLYADDITFDATANWSCDAFNGSGKGLLSAQGYSITLNISVLVGADAAGHPNVTTTGCYFDAGPLDFALSGNANWFHNIFNSAIADDIRGDLNKHICSDATSYINTTANKVLSTLPMVVQLDDVAELNYALTRAPDFNDTYVMTYHKGEILSVSNPNIEAPFYPSALPPFTDTPKKMVAIWVTDYVFNTAILVYKRANYLNYNITPDMVSNLGIKLDTNTFAPLIPQLYEKYPNKNLTLGLRAVDKPPFVATTPGGANFTLPGAVDFYVLNGNSTPVAFTLGVMAYLDLNASLSIDSEINCLKISANATFFKAELSVLESNIGDIQVSKLQSVLDTLGKTLIIPQINKYLNFGITIPTLDGLYFIFATLSLKDGYVMIDSDISYA